MTYVAYVIFFDKALASRLSKIVLATLSHVAPETIRERATGAAGVDPITVFPNLFVCATVDTNTRYLLGSSATQSLLVLQPVYIHPGRQVGSE